MSALPRFTRTQWLICIIASIGFAFDIYELLMLPLIVRPALQELVGASPGSPEFEHWVGLLFFVPAIVGGVFGLLGGYLTDLWGRRRVLVGSILLYAFSACAAGFSTSVEMLLVLRCTTFVGVCVEFVAAVAWLAELFPEPKQREAVLGFTQAFSSLGGMLVTAANWFAIQYGDLLPAINGGHEAWRYTLISGVIPALPLILIRPFLPESPVWARKKEAGTLRRPSIGELFSPRYRRTTIVTTVMFACSYGAAFGALQHTPRIVPSLPEVRQATEGKPVPEQKRIEQQTAAEVNFYQEIGGLCGRFLLAVGAIWIVSRRTLMRVFQLPGLILIPLVYVFPAHSDLELLKWGIFAAGIFTIAQFSFWGNYLPRVYPVHLRGTGESFAANIGGRMIGTSAALVTTTLTPYMPGRSTALAAASVVFAVYVIGSIFCFWLPEPAAEATEEEFEMPLFMLILGLIALVGGAELLVRGASRLASAVGISPLVVGLTVVAFGTSAPEMAVSVASAFSGRADIAMGNVVGSNIFNVLFILGLSALVVPLVVDQKLVRFDVPLMIAASLLVLLLGYDGSIGRIEGGALFAGVIAYTAWCIVAGRSETPKIQPEYAEAFGGGKAVAGQTKLREGRRAALLWQVGLIAAGLVLLVLGAGWLVDSATELARRFGVSELVIGLTIVAAGTSLPELATSVVAAIRGERDIAVGNVVGSNIFNILAVLGLSSAIAPAGVVVADQALRFDVPVMIAVAIACLPIFFTGHRIARWEGALFLAYYVAYTSTLVMLATGSEVLPLFRLLMNGFILPLTAITLTVVATRAIASTRDRATAVRKET